MSSREKKIVAIIGGTGAMGRPIIGGLSESNEYQLRVLTRDSQSELAKELQRKYPTIELVEGNFADEEAIRRLLQSAYGVFCNTDNWGCGGFQNEIDHGKKIFDIAKELSVQHFLYSSLDNTQKLLANDGGFRCYHYESKAIVAEYIQSHDPKQIPWTIITTGPYYENFQAPFLPKKDPHDPDQLIFTLPMADKPMILVAIDDIVWFVKYSLENPHKSQGKNFYIASDNITMDELVRTFTEVTGIRAKYNPVSVEEFVEKIPYYGKMDFDQRDDFRGFYQQFLKEKVKRDFKALKEIHPGLLNWKQWLEKTGWKGEQKTVQSNKTYYQRK